MKLNNKKKIKLFHQFVLKQFLSLIHYIHIEIEYEHFLAIGKPKIMKSSEREKEI